MRCPSCGVENAAGRKFCVECGGKLALSCKACGTPHAPSEKFCGECGATLKEVESPQSRVKSEESGNSGLSTLDSRAAALIARTGAKTLAPALCEWRAELAGVLGDEATRVQLLREAHQLYEQIGAPLQAQRIGQLLSESTS